MNTRWIGSALTNGLSGPNQGMGDSLGCESGITSSNEPSLADRTPVRLIGTPAYLRAMDHTLTLCSDLLKQVKDLTEAQRMVNQAQSLASDLRFRPENKPPLNPLDLIWARLRWARQQEADS